MSNEIVLATESNTRTALARPDVIEQFRNILGQEDEAKRYIGSVLIAVSASPELQDCSLESIIRTAARCAANRLSCDPEAKQGQLVPRWNSKKGCKEATLIVHYKGMYNQAMRTGLYRNINVSECYKGYEVTLDILTGIHSVKMNPAEFDPKIVIGYIGYFKTKDGVEKTVWWPIERIQEHIATYAPKNPLYNDKKTARAMREKIVWRDLLSWTDKHTDKRDAIDDILSDDVEPAAPGAEHDDIAEGEAKDIPAEQPEISPEESAYIFAGEIKTKKGTALKECDDDMLAMIITNSKDAELVDFARTRLEWHNTHPNPVKTQKQLMTEMGY